jgi:hypothetical protein
MQPCSTTTPAVIALIVAIVGTLILLKMDLDPRHAVRNGGLDNLSRAAIAKAGATATPTIEASE